MSETWPRVGRDQQRINKTGFVKEIEGDWHKRAIQ